MSPSGRSVMAFDRAASYVGAHDRCNWRIFCEPGLTARLLELPSSLLPLPSSWRLVLRLYQPHQADPDRLEMGAQFLHRSVDVAGGDVVDEGGVSCMVVTREP